MDQEMVLWVVLLFGLLCGAQELREQDASCSAEGCYAVYFQRRSFLESWRSCREQGGNLATIKRPEEAALVEELFHGLGLAEERGKMRFWIGLQRQPRQCSPHRPLRGFTWMTGDQDTLYTNWLRPEGSPTSTCAAPRCVVMSYGASGDAQQENFKWLDGSCTLPVDGFVCKFQYKGMCPGITGEEGTVRYATPFNLVSTLLTYVPFGSVASVPCGGGLIPELSILCMLKEDGTIGWSKESPYCPEEQMRHGLELHHHPLPSADSCDQDNGGCDHICVDEGQDYYCECDEGYTLMENGHGCTQADPCESNPCEFDCVNNGHGFLCSCPDGYMLGPDGRGCQDVDECAESSCDQLCLNFAGGFECQCHLGYHLEDGQCRDADECAAQAPCEHACENTAGSYACHCHLGFSPSEEDPHRCVDTDECRIADMCQQMCVNYVGGFECYCNEGYELDPDGISCHPLSEPGSDSEELYLFLPTTLGHPSPDTSPWDYSDEESTDETLLVTITPEPETTSQARTTLPRMTTAPPFNAIPTTAMLAVWFHEWTTQLWAASEAVGTTTTTTLGLTTWNEPLPVHLPEEEVADGPLSGADFTSSKDAEPTLAPTKSLKAAGTSTLLMPVETSPQDRIPSLGRVTSESIAYAGTPKGPTTAPEAIPGSEGPQRAAQKRDDRWLLVALLVPLCIFLVIMLALGIVYCTRCGAKAKPKSVTDCYRWITNKNPAPATGKASV